MRYLLLLVLLIATTVAAVADERLVDGPTVVRYPAGRERTARRVLAQTGVLRSLIGARFEIELGAVEVSLVSDHAGLERLAGGPVPVWALAIALSDEARIGVRLDHLDGRINQLSPTLAHELMHVALAVVERRGGRRLPRWFNEGVCEWYSGTLHHAAHHELTRDAALGVLIPFETLRHEFPADPAAAARAYLQCHSFVSHLALILPGRIETVLGRFGEGWRFEDAVTDVMGLPPAVLEAEWRQTVTPRYPRLWLLVDSVSLFAVAALLVLAARWRQRRRERALRADWPEDPDLEREMAVVGWRGTEDP